MLVLCQIDDRSQTLCVHIFIEERMLHTLRHKIKQDLFELPRIDRPAIRRKADLHSEHCVTALRIDTARRALQYLLGATAHRDQPALSRSLCLKSELFRTPSELPRQLILQGDALIVFPI